MSGHVLPFFAIAGAELRRCEAAVNQHCWGEDRAAGGQHVGGEVHLVIERAIEPAGGHGVGAVAVDDVSRDDAGAAEADADGLRSRCKFTLFAEVTHLFLYLLRILFEPGIALYDEPDVAVTLEQRG